MTLPRLSLFPLLMGIALAGCPDSEPAGNAVPEGEDSIAAGSGCVFFLDSTQPVEDVEEAPVVDVVDTSSGNAPRTDATDVETGDALDGEQVETVDDVQMDVSVEDGFTGEGGDDTSLLDADPGEQDSWVEEDDASIVEEDIAVVEEGGGVLYTPLTGVREFSDDEGRFLHDFSYAGYHNGEAPLPEVELEGAFDVVADFGADSSGETDATSAIQAAIDGASDAGGGVVYFPSGVYRLDGTC